MIWENQGQRKKIFFGFIKKNGLSQVKQEADLKN